MKNDTKAIELSLKEVDLLTEALHHYMKHYETDFTAEKLVRRLVDLGNELDPK